MEDKGLHNFEIYQIALELSNMAWDIFQSISKTHQFSIGNQFLRSTDSIGANIAEGFGRYIYKDSLRFYYHSRGSFFETKHWITLLFKRHLIEENVHKSFEEKLNVLGIKLNNFINFIKSKLNN